MNKKIWILITAAAIVVVLVGGVVGYNMLDEFYTTETSEEPTESSTLAKDFTVLNAEGQSVKLSQRLGKPIILNFWATWCGPCQMEMPAFDTLAAQYGEDVDFMMINLTDGARDSVESAAAFIESKGYSFPLYFDTTLTAADTYGAYSIPLTVFINKNGEVVQTHVGAMDEATLERYIKNLL